jgi:predicted lipid-binding transport protein (Tim44 family)
VVIPDLSVAVYSWATVDSKRTIHAEFNFENHHRNRPRQRNRRKSHRYSVEPRGHARRQGAVLFEKLPGAAELAAAHGGDGAGGGGLMGMLAGGLMGGPLAMITKLQAIGLNVDQIKKVGTLTLDHAKKQAGIKAVREAAANIPGLNTYI